MTVDPGTSRSAHRAVRSGIDETVVVPWAWAHGGFTPGGESGDVDHLGCSGSDQAAGSTPLSDGVLKVGDTNAGQCMEDDGLVQAGGVDTADAGVLRPIIDVVTVGEEDARVVLAEAVVVLAVRLAGCEGDASAILRYREWTEGDNVIVVGDREDVHNDVKLAGRAADGDVVIHARELQVVDGNAVVVGGAYRRLHLRARSRTGRRRELLEEEDGRDAQHREGDGDGRVGHAGDDGGHHHDRKRRQKGHRDHWSERDVDDAVSGGQVGKTRGRPADAAVDEADDATCHTLPAHDPTVVDGRDWSVRSGVRVSDATG